MRSLIEKIDSNVIRWFGASWILARQCHSIVERVKWVIPFVRSTGGAVLDAGSGGGAAAFVLAQQGFAVTALELEPRASNIRRRYDMIKDRLPGSIHVTALDLRAVDRWPDPSRFDHIILFEVIEHIVNDEKLVRDLAIRLNPGGRLYITTPNERYHGFFGDSVHETEVRASEFPDRSTGGTAVDLGHVRWGYSEARLREICAMSGLEVEHVTYHCGFFGQQLINFRRVLHRFAGINQNVTIAVSYPLRALLMLDRFLPYEPASIAVMARRG